MIVCMDFILFLSCMVVLSFYVNLINLLSFFDNLLIIHYSVGVAMFRKVKRMAEGQTS